MFESDPFIGIPHIKTTPSLDRYGRTQKKNLDFRVSCGLKKVKMSSNPVDASELRFKRYRKIMKTVGKKRHGQEAFPKGKDLPTNHQFFRMLCEFRECISPCSTIVPDCYKSHNHLL